MGTNLGATFLSLSRFANILTKTIVVDISLSPVDFIKFSKIFKGGVLIGFEKVLITVPALKKVEEMLA